MRETVILYYLLFDNSLQINQRAREREKDRNTDRERDRDQRHYNNVGSLETLTLAHFNDCRQSGRERETNRDRDKENMSTSCATQDISRPALGSLYQS